MNVMSQYLGPISKMKTDFNSIVQYSLMLGDDKVNMNELIDKSINLTHTGRIFCVSCGKQTKKSFGQGFCYPCFMNSPDNSECIIKPELCRAHLGEGRDIEWEKNHHLQPHYVYLALSNEVKVGVTRSTQVPTRWIDQGASAAIIIAEVPYRQLAGVIELELKKHMTDKTNWQRMLKNEIAQGVSMIEKRDAAIEMLPDDLKKYTVASSEVIEINYPVLQYPIKVVSQNFDKTAEITGVLKGIKGQYLLFDGGRVLNIRNASGYEVKLELN